MTDYLFLAGTLVIIAAVAARAFGWLRLHQAYGLMALSQVIVGVAGFVTGNTVAACISAAAAAITAWQWWNGGGGDGTRRRLRKWSGRFRGVRRTAPAGAQ